MWVRFLHAGPNQAAVAHQVERQTENLCVAGSSPARGTKKFNFFSLWISTNIMLSIITEQSNPLLDYIKDDPVRPEIPREFRVSGHRFVGVLINESPQAIVCVSLHDFVPASVEDLYVDASQPTTAIFYTIWSYAPGAGVELLRATVNEIRNRYPSVTRFVTLSPKTEMARRFHIKNGAVVFRENEATINYEYTV